MALLPAATSRVMPAGFSNNVTFFLANMTLDVPWSSELVRIPSFVMLNGTDYGFEFSILPQAKQLPAAFSSNLSVGSDLALELPLADERLGGEFFFSVEMYFYRATEPQSNTGSGNTAWPSEKILAASKAIQITVLPFFAKFQLDVSCESACSESAVEALARSAIAQQMDVDESRVFLHATSPLLLDVHIWATSRDSALAHQDAVKSSPPTVPGATLTVRESDNGVYFLDSAAAAGSEYLTLRQESWELLACDTCGGTYVLSDIVRQITAFGLPVGKDRLPVYALELEYVRHRTSVAAGYSTWRSESGFLSRNSVSCNVSENKSLVFEFGNSMIIEVEYRVQVVGRSAAALQRINVAPKNTAPAFSLEPPASTASGGVCNDESCRVWEDSGPFDIGISNISRGGWEGTSNLSYAFSFSQAPLPLVSGIDFDAACNTSSSCSARMSLLASHFGVTTISITLRNAGQEFTPFGTDSYTLDFELRVADINDAPSFVKATAALNVDEDSSCIGLPTAGLSPTAKKVCAAGPALQHSYPGFMMAISAGAYEDRSQVSCPPTDRFAAAPGACLAQNVSFDVAVAAGQAASPGSIFAEFPKVHANGTLQFRLLADQVGLVMFNVTIRDDGTPPQSWWDVFSIFVLSVNDAPSFMLNPESGIITVYEGSGHFSRIVIDNITAGCLACVDENENYCGVGGNDHAACQTVGIDVAYTLPAPELFTANGRPRLDRSSVTQATLSFDVATGFFGEAYVDVNLYDSGGRQRKGNNTSERRRLVIRVVPVNDPPSFKLTRSLVTVDENSGASVMQIAADITAGNSNENCAVSAESVGCEAQKVTFVIEYIEDARLFSRLPAIDTNGTLSFAVYAGVTGASRVYTRLEDNGMVNAGSRGNVSATQMFAIVVKPIEYQANFSLVRNVACLQLADVGPGKCSCPRLTTSQSSIEVCARTLQPGEVSYVEIMEDSGPIVIEEFVTHITNAAGYLPASLSVFTRDEATGLLEFQEQRKDQFTGMWGLEYVSDFRVTNDQRHLYATEAETDSVSVFDLTQGPDALHRIFHFTDAEHLLVFRRPNAANLFSRTPVSVPTQALSSLATFTHKDMFYALAAQGTMMVRDDVAVRKRALAEIEAGRNQEERYKHVYEPTDLWEVTIACWIFDLASVFASPGMDEAELQARFNVDPDEFVDTERKEPNYMPENGLFDDRSRAENKRVSRIECGRNGCSFARNVTEIDNDWCPRFRATRGGENPCVCEEKFPTFVQYASARDLKEHMGPLFLTGPQCKTMSSCTETSPDGHASQCPTRGRVSSDRAPNDWDVARDQLDLRTFVFGNDQLQAMQFDDNLNTGLFLTFDMRRVKDRMPTGAFSVEVWFTIDQEPSDELSPVRRALVGVESYMDTDSFKCMQGWSLSYTHHETETTLRFFVGVKNSMLDDSPYEVEVARIPQGVWQHVVASYDGSRMLSIFLNGVKLGEKSACFLSKDSSICGDIQYPGIQAVSEEERYTKCTLRPANFSVGGWKNGEDQLKEPKDFRSWDYRSMGKHHGAIHMVRIYNTSLTSVAVSGQYNRTKDKMAENNMVPPVRSWSVKQYKGSNSPSIDFAHASAPERVEVHGSFAVFDEHRCEWHVEPPLVGKEEEITYTQAITTESRNEGYLGETLSCYTPLWEHGVRLTRFFISSKQGDGRWKRLWMKVCLDAGCGFVLEKDGRQQSYFVTPNLTNVSDANSTRYTLRSNVHAVPKDFRFIHSSGLHKLDMTAEHVKGAVSNLTTVVEGSNLVHGTVRILPDAAGISGRMFSASFTASAEGTGGEIQIENEGFGYPTSGRATICHLNSNEPMDGTAIHVAVLEGHRGTGYIPGVWEVAPDSDSADGSTAPVKCAMSPKGNFTTTDISPFGDGGEVQAIEILLRGSGCETEDISGVQLYYPGSGRAKQDGSVSYISGISSTFPGQLAIESNGGQTPEDTIPAGTTEITAMVLDGSGNELGKNFSGACQLVHKGAGVEIVGVRIIDHGFGFSNDGEEKKVVCVYQNQQFSITGPTVFVVIPDGEAKVEVKVARVDSVISFTAAANGILMLPEPGLASARVSGIWGNQGGESARPLWPAAFSMEPVKFKSGDQVETFVLVSNFWDGLTGNRTVLTEQGFQLVDHEISYLMLVDDLSGVELRCVQAINTGAASFHHFKMMDADYLVAANYMEVLSSGETTTTAWSRIYRFGLGNPAHNAPKAPGIGGQKAPHRCSTDSLLGRAPVWTSHATRFRTNGAVAVKTFVMHHSTRYGQVRYMAVANYYDSDKQISTGLSKLYMLGRPQNNTHSLFGVNITHLWKRCSDTRVPCKTDEHCFVHKCDQGCVITRRPGQEPSISCRCSNRPSKVCSVDTQCNSDIQCIPLHESVPLENHMDCLKDEMVGFEGDSREGNLVMCETQNFDVVSAHSVAHWHSNDVHVLVFASDSATALSKVFVSKDGAQPFVEVQALMTTFATQLHVMQPKKLDRTYLLVAQGTGSILYRWNGTILEQKQQIDEIRGNAMVASSYIEQGDLMYAIFGGGNEALHNTLSLMQGFDTKIPGLDAPGALEVDPHGQDIYVFSSRSRTISHFDRDNVTGELQFKDVTAYPYVDGVTGVPHPMTPWGSEIEESATIIVHKWNDVVRDNVSTPTPPANQDEVLRRDLPNIGQYGYPARGVLSTVIAADGMYLYAAAYFDNAVHIWSRDAISGQLTWKSTFSDPVGNVDLRRGRTGLGPGNYFLRGPQAMVLGTSAGGNMMLVACALSQSLVLLQRDISTGELSFVDAARDGERNILTFKSSAPMSPYARPFPTRIGGKSGAGAGAARQQQEREWARTARVVRPFVLRGRQLLAIAASENHPHTKGAAVIMEWKADVVGPNATNMGFFEQVQVLVEDTSAVDVEYFEIDVAGTEADEYLVVANAFGMTRVYIWEESGFVLHHIVPMARLAYDGQGCSCLCNTGGLEASTDIICGTCFRDAVMRQSDDSACNAEQWPSEARACSAKALQLLPQSIRHFFVESSREHFLAVAYWSANSGNTAVGHGSIGCRRVYSHIYRWNEDNPRQLESGNVVWGSGFEPLFPIATSGAVGFEHIAVDHADRGQTDLVGVAEFVGALDSPAFVRLFRYVRYGYNPFLKTSAGSFEVYQLLPVAAAYSLHAFRIDGEGSFLAVAVRQATAAPPVNLQTGAGRGAFLATYDAASVVLKWNGTFFEKYQTLRGDDRISFQSIAAPPRAFDQNEEPSFVNCSLSPAARGCPTGVGWLAEQGWPMAEGLRGATSIHSFEDVDGEFYLAVAQSVCDPEVPNSLCNHTAHPMSSILQWDRVHKRFTDALAFTDESFGRRFGGSRVRDEDILLHQTALRIPAGRAARFSTMVVGGSAAGVAWPGVVNRGVVRGRVTMLLVASMDEGALAYEFRFNEVVGLAGAAAVTISPEEDFVYVASEVDKAIAVFHLNRSYHLDITLRPVSTFRQVQVLSEDPIEGGFLIREPITHGLRGIRHLRHSNIDCAGYTVDNSSSSGSRKTYQKGELCSTILLRGGVPRTQLPCGSRPPVQFCSPTTPELCTPSIDELEPRAACRDISFRIEVSTALSNPLLFTDDGMPHLVDKGPGAGTLMFTPRNGQTGEARFRVVMEKALSSDDNVAERMDSSANVPISREFVIEIVQVNDPPVIGSIRDVIVLADSGRLERVFATDIFAEGKGFAHYNWQWDIVNMTLRGFVNMTLRMLRHCEHDASHAEAEHGVNCTTLNQSLFPPLQDRQAVIDEYFVTTPTFSFRRDQYGKLEGLVSFETRPTKFGNLTIYVRMHDGTDEDPRTGGSPVSEQFNFLLRINPVNYAPNFTVSKSSFLLEEGDNAVVQAGFVTDIQKGLLDFEIDQEVSFSLSHVEPINVLGWDTSKATDIVAQFNIALDGTLTFRMATDFAGDVRLFMKIEDDAWGTFGGISYSLQPLDVSVQPFNDRPRLKDNGAMHFKCSWINVTTMLNLTQSQYLRVPVTQAFNCDFKENMCGYINMQGQNNTEGSKVEWMLATNRIYSLQKEGQKYRGTGPEYGQAATSCSTFASEPMVDPRPSCVPEGYIAADARNPTRDFGVGDFGVLKTKPTLAIRSGTFDFAAIGENRRTLRTESAIEVIYSFYYHMFDGYPSYESYSTDNAPPHGTMGSLTLEARSGTEGNWTAVWSKVGAQNNYHAWAYTNVSLGLGFLQGSGLQLRFVAKKISKYNMYSVMALDTMQVSASVLRDDRTFKCHMELTVTGVFFDAVRRIEQAIQIEQPPDEMVSQELMFTLVLQSGHELFFDAPFADLNGTLVLPLARAGRGRAVILVSVEDTGPRGGLHEFELQPFLITVVVDGFEELPPFTLLNSLTVLDGAGLESFPNFAHVETLAKLPDASLEFIRFVVRCTSTAPGMWAHDPSVDPLGTLTLAVTTGFSGQAYCKVQLGGADGSVSDTLSPPQYFYVKVWPRPEVRGITPALANPFTSTAVTVHGRNFGSLVSRGYSAPTYANITAYVTTAYSYSVAGRKKSAVKWEPCADGTKYVSDDQLLCTIPPGAGMRDVKVEIVEDGLNRTGVLLDAFVGVEMWLGGTAEDPHCQAFGAPWPHRQEAIEHCGNRGFLGSGPGPLHLPPKFDMARLNISSSVRALVVSKETVFVGGSFAKVNSTRVNGILAYDRERVRGLALGLDGSVSSLALVHRERGLVIAGGSFTRVYQASGSLPTGGLALWDDTSSQWGALGGALLHGICLCLIVKETEIVVGGRFSGAGDVDAANIAVFRIAEGAGSRGIVLDLLGVRVRSDGIAGNGGGGWSALGEGIKGVVHALAAGQATEVYAGGRFPLAGGVRVENIAKWESVEGSVGGGYWTGLVDSDCLRFKDGVCGVNGDVWALAFVGERLYVGGQFSLAGGKPANNVARWTSGVWESVGKGVNGAVYLLTAIRIQGTQAGSCVYFAGDFRKVEDERGSMDAPGFARWCIGDPSSQGKGSEPEYWELAALPEGVLSVRAISPHY